MQHYGKHLCAEFRERGGNRLVVALAARAKAVVVPEEHGAHAALLDEFLTDKFIERESCDFGRKRQHQEIEPETLDELALFFGGGEEQRVAGATQHVVGMGFKGDDGRSPAVDLGDGLERAEKRLVPQVAPVKIAHRHGSFLFLVHRHSFPTLSSPRKRGSSLLIFP